jgi:hypothetical protein
MMIRARRLSGVLPRNICKLSLSCTRGALYLYANTHLYLRLWCLPRVNIINIYIYSRRLRKFDHFGTFRSNILGHLHLQPSTQKI